MAWETYMGLTNFTAGSAKMITPCCISKTFLGQMANGNASSMGTMTPAGVLRTP